MIVRAYRRGRSRSGIEAMDLPVVKVASIVHRGGTDGIDAVYQALIAWIQNAGYQLAGSSRELYQEIAPRGPSVTERQLPTSDEPPQSPAHPVSLPVAASDKAHLRR
jgi:hypothetical protein